MKSKSNLYPYLAHFCILIFLSSCQTVKTEFSESELRWLNVYNNGDTLIFRSENGRLDTSYIVEKKIYYPEHIPIEVHGKYLPHTGVVGYKNASLEYQPAGGEMISMFKVYPNKQTRLFISYLNSTVIILDLTADSIKKYKNDGIYEFNSYHPKGKMHEPKKIFWNEDHGVVKYITNDNIVWERINVPKL